MGGFSGNSFVSRRMSAPPPVPLPSGGRLPNYNPNPRYPPQSTSDQKSDEDDEGVLYCFSSDPLAEDEKEGDNNRIANVNSPISFQTAMKDAFCAQPLCCIGTCITCTYGTSWCLRREVLQHHSKFVDWEPTDANYGRKEKPDFWKHWKCCQGFAPCLQDKLDGCTDTMDPNAKACLACCECCCCAGCAISGSRQQIITEYDLHPDKTDNQLIRLNNCYTLRKFKCIPFVWESQNYLVKVKNDTHFLVASPFRQHFNFSTKSDPFLVYSSMKQSSIAPGGQARNLRNMKDRKFQKTTIPLPNSLMKLIRQSEVYLMEEAVTE